ncbi:TPA: hypothetical protein ACXNW8_003452 [Clostridium botulinum]
MTYKEVEIYLDMGYIVKSSQCLYIKIIGAIHWKWIGEDEWTVGDNKLMDHVNDIERKGNWELLFNCNSNKY